MHTYFRAAVGRTCRPANIREGALHCKGCGRLAKNPAWARLTSKVRPDRDGGGALADIIAPPTDAEGGLFSETNDNSVDILLTYGTARVLLAGDAEAKGEEYMATGPYTGRSRWSKNKNTHALGRGFRVVLADEDTPEHLELVTA
jgi:hypothetical protein